MKRVGWSFVALGLAMAVGSVAPHAEAKRTGMNLACHNCHEGRDKPQLSVTLSAPRIEVGGSVTLDIVAKHERAKVGGVLVDSHELGAFQLVDPVGTHLFESSMTQATHAMPQAYANGQVQFSFSWVAPMTVGAYQFEVWTNAGNDNMKPEDDSATEVITGVGVGCDAVWYYFDNDKDGAGTETDKMLSCTVVPDRITQGGDCDDHKPEVNPAAVETCNSVDDDCDGTIDDGFKPVLLVVDVDGDGFGARTGKSMIGCPPKPGYAPNFEDCNDGDATVHPGAAEIANGRDDDCNDQVDESPSGTAGSSGVAGSSGTAGTANTPPPTTPAADSGCAFTPARSLQPLGSLHLFGAAAMLLGWARARRTVRRLASGYSKS